MNSHFIKDCLLHEVFVVIKPIAKIIWPGGNPVLITFKNHLNDENIQDFMSYAEREDYNLAISLVEKGISSM